jgi:hypothetical protein
MKRLKFNFGNAKLNERIAILNLPAGWACPLALKCLSKADPDTGKITDGPEVEFRCFGAAGERYPAVRALRWHNFNLLRECKDLQSMVDLITASLPDVKYIRPHSDGGDFFSETYFLAWLNVAINHPDRVFYTYTKRPDFIVKYKNQIPSNFRLTASYGGKLDHLIGEHNLKNAIVFFSEDEAATAGREIDKDDSHAILPDKGSFGLLLHSHQPKGSPAAKAWYKIMKAGKGYSGKKPVAPSTPVVKANITVGLDN